jgi:zinc/manganese transport system substrate-binding protein
MRRRTLLRTAALAVLATAGAVLPGSIRAQQDERLHVLATTTDLREIAKAVGGEHVEVTCVTKGPEDPHFVEARPSLIRAAAKADVLLVTGLELEIGYEPLLLSESRNAKIQKGRPGYVDASAGIVTLEVPRGPVDRTMGDVHAFGNPHYLQDPVRAKKAAGTIAEAFAKNDPDHADSYRERLAAFRRELDVALWGEALLAEVRASRLERRLARGKLLAYLKEKELSGKLGGLAARLAPHAGRKVVSYHGLWIYLFDRFGLVEAAKVEPKPGVSPSPRHLAKVARIAKKERARVLVHATYHPERTAKRAAELGGARVLKLAHMPGALPGTDSYLAMLRSNVERLAGALARTKSK